jgi:SM-20-related protein
MIDEPEATRATCSWVICDEFLAPGEAGLVLSRAVDSATVYRPSEVMSGDRQTLDASYRRSAVCYHELTAMTLLQMSIMAHVDMICERLRIPPFSVSRMEIQLARSGHGGYYKPHRDNNNERARSRRLTCVYYVHREPKAFHGGELRLHTPCRDRSSSASKQYIDIEPGHNRLIAFPSWLVHEVLPVTMRSTAVADQRFSMNAWLHA